MVAEKLIQFPPNSRVAEKLKFVGSIRNEQLTINFKGRLTGDLEFRATFSGTRAQFADPQVQDDLEDVLQSKIGLCIELSPDDDAEMYFERISEVLQKKLGEDDTVEARFKTKIGDVSLNVHVGPCSPTVFPKRLNSGFHGKLRPALIEEFGETKREQGQKPLEAFIKPPELLGDMPKHLIDEINESDEEEADELMENAEALAKEIEKEGIPVPLTVEKAQEIADKAAKGLALVQENMSFSEFAEPKQPIKPRKKKANPLITDESP